MVGRPYGIDLTTPRTEYLSLSREAPINEITASELLTTLQRIEKRGALEVARRVRGICSMIFRYAVASGIAERDPSADLLGALTPPPKRHFASITDPKRVG